jgi:hypothetical protein
VNFEPPSPEKVEAALRLALGAGIIILGKEKTEEICAQSLGKHPKLTFQDQP